MRDLTGLQLVAFLGLAMLVGAAVCDLTFGRHDRARARHAEQRAARAERRAEALERQTAVRRRRPTRPPARAGRTA